MTSFSQTPGQYAASTDPAHSTYGTTYAYDTAGHMTASTTVSQSANGPVTRISETSYDAHGNPDVSQDTFLLNGHIEDGLNSWTTGGGVTLETTTVSDGFGAFKVSSTGTATQTSQLVPGQTVRFQLDARGSSGTSATYAVDYQKASDGSWHTLLASTNESATSYTTHGYDLTIPMDGNGSVRVTLSRTGSGAAYFDALALFTGYSDSDSTSAGLQTQDTDAFSVDSETTYDPSTHHPAIYATSSIANYVSGMSSTDDRNVTSTTTYNSWGNPLTETDPDGGTITTSYAANHTDVDSTSDALSRTTSYTYDEIGQKLSETDPLGKVTTYTYDWFGNVTRVVGPSPTDYETRTTYDDVGRQVTLQENYVDGDPGTGLETEDVTTSDTLDEYGRVVSETKGGVTSDNTYDQDGNLTKMVVDSGSGNLNLETDYAYDADGNQIAIRDPRGTITRNFYDADGNLVETIENCTNSGTTIPSGWESCAGTGTSNATWNLVTTHAYDLNGNEVQSVAPNGRVTTTAYDGEGRTIWSTQNDVAGTPSSPDQDLTNYSFYDKLGRETTTYTPSVNRSTYLVTRTFYDAAGRSTQSVGNCTNSGTTALSPTDGDCAATGTANADTNASTSWTYDAGGQKLAETAPDPSDSSSGTGTVVTRYAYDDGGRLCRVLENAQENLQSLTHPCTSSLTVTPTDSSNVSTAYGYDAAGNLTSATDGRGNTQSYGYDSFGHMTSRTDGLSATLYWTYDKRGNRLTQANRVGSPAVAITWHYDHANRMTKRTADSVDTTYTYDENGNQLSATGPAGSISTTYDRLSRPTDTTPDDGSADTVTTYSFTAPTRTDASGSSTFAIDAYGRETGAALPLSATAFITTYRADGQLSERDDPNGNMTAFGYDGLGRLLTKNTTGTGSVSRAAYTYTDNRAGQRLSEASTISGDPGNGTASFGYDAMGRLVSYGSPLGSTSSQSYGWQAVPNRSSVTTDPSGTPSTTNYSYDAADRISTSGYTYDADGNLTALPGQTLDWDSLGRLLDVKDATTHSTISAYTYDALDRLRTEARSSGTIRFRYVGTSTEVSQTVDDSSGTSILKVGNGWDGQRLADWTGSGSTPRYYGTNGHGDTTWIADGLGSVTATERYDPWGTQAAASGTMADWRFQGSWLDSSSGLYWLIARWYAPALGSFVSEDRELSDRTVLPMNQSAYTANDPSTAIHETREATALPAKHASGSVRIRHGMTTQKHKIKTDMWDCCGIQMTQGRVVFQWTSSNGWIVGLDSGMVLIEHHHQELLGAGWKVATSSAHLGPCLIACRYQKASGHVEFSYAGAFDPTGNLYYNTHDQAIKANGDGTWTIGWKLTWRNSLAWHWEVWVDGNRVASGPAQ
jgi:RHS repeat-associated protein